MLITQGFTSAYSIWSAMRNESKVKHDSIKVLAYKNIYQRTINLLKAGYLEEIKLELVNMHGRRDYKLTIKGMNQLLLHVISHPDDLKNIIDYMDKVKLNKQPFINTFVNLLGAIIHVSNLINKYTEEMIYISRKGDIISIKHTRKPKRA